eukprot:COSAG03_NODE_17439_length_375_cov_1.119565_1_plen_30_part_10
MHACAGTHARRARVEGDRADITAMALRRRV